MNMSCLWAIKSGVIQQAIRYTGLKLTEEIKIGDLNYRLFRTFFFLFITLISISPAFRYYSTILSQFVFIVSCSHFVNASKTVVLHYEETQVNQCFATPFVRQDA